MKFKATLPGTIFASLQVGMGRLLISLSLTEGVILMKKITLWGFITLRGYYVQIALVLTLTAFFTSACYRPDPPDYTGSTYLIICPEDLMNEVADLASFKESQGFLVETVTLESILSEYEGADDPEKVRNYLISKYQENPKKEFVLLVGSMDSMPMRITMVNPFYDSPWEYRVPTDFYYGELTCDWDVDGDGRYGEWGDDMTKGNCDYKVEAWVGRLPWDDPSVIQAMVNTIIAYETDESERMKKAIGAGATIVSPCDAALYLSLAKNTYMQMSGYDSTALYEQCPSLHPDLELTRDNFLNTWEALEPGFVAWFSHGSSYASYYNSSPYTFIDIDNLPQVENPAIAITTACTVGDPEVESLGRVLVKEGVAAGFVGASRPNAYGDNRLPAYIAQFQMGRYIILYRQALSAAIANAIEYYVQHEIPVVNTPGPDFHRNIFEMIVYGDPSIQVR